jgi:hypothetical protein
MPHHTQNVRELVAQQTDPTQFQKKKTKRREKKEGFFSWII